MEYVKANNGIHVIDEGRSHLLSQFRKNPLTPSQNYRMNELFVQCFAGMFMLLPAYIYSGSIISWLRGISKGKAFFSDIINNQYKIREKIKNRNRLVRVATEYSLDVALSLIRIHSLRVTLSKVKYILLRRFFPTDQKPCQIGGDFVSEKNTNNLIDEQRHLGYDFVNCYRYKQLISRTEPQSKEDIESLSAKLVSWTTSLLLTVHMHVEDCTIVSMKETISSVIQQIYPHWELLITAPPSVLARETLNSLLGEFADDMRISILTCGESEYELPENIALNTAKGKFFMRLNSGDLLPPHSLYYFALEIEQHPGVHLVYSDSDVVTDGIRHSPFFKPDWNEELFLNQDYICQLTAYDTAKLLKGKGFRRDYAPCHAYDVALRLAASSKDGTIRHIPRVLYHYRHNDFCLFSLDNREKACQAAMEYLKGKSIKATVISTDKGLNRVTYAVKTPLPMVSCIIGMKDRAAMTRNCLKGILQETDYDNLEVILVDNESVESDSLVLFADLQEEKRVRIIHWKKAFNYSQIQNMGVNEAKGEVVALLNNDIEIIDSAWLREMVGYAQKPHVGAVGARLLFPDDTLQHAGIILGPNGAVGYAFRGQHKETPLQKNLAHAARWISAVTGACLVVSKDKYLEVGGLNEKDLGIGFNDVDFCIRLHLAGYHNVYTPYATLRHLESASRGSDTVSQKRKRARMELLYIIDRYADLLYADPQYNLNLSFYGTNYDVIADTENLRLCPSINTGF